MGSCPTPGKRAYPSKRAARQGIRTMNQNRANSGTKRIHVYPCAGHWHVGHITRRP